MNRNIVFTKHALTHQPNLIDAALNHPVEIAIRCASQKKRLLKLSAVFF